MEERRWYADWRVWFCILIAVSCGFVQWLVGLPLRILDALWIFN